MKPLFTSIPATLIFSLCVGAFSPPPCLAAEDQAARPWDRMSFTEKIIRLDEEARDLMSLDQLLYLKRFKKLSSEAGRNIDDCLQFLSEPGHISIEKDFAVLSMNELELADYIRFSRGLIDLARRGLISKYQVSLAVSPPDDCTHLLLINYQDKNVREILKAIKALPDTDGDYKRYIDDVLSGKALEKKIDFKRDCCIDSTEWTHLPKQPWTGFENLASYSEKIIAIDKVETRIVTDTTLIGFKPFDDLSNEGGKNIDECLKFLAAGGQIRQQRQIAILSMHELGLKDYVHFMQEIIGLYHRGLVTSAELDLAFFPGPNFSRVLTENYRDKDVQDIFRAVRARAGITEDEQQALDRYLSGKDMDALVASVPKTKFLTPPE